MIVVGTVDADECSVFDVDVADANVGGKRGLHGECELAEVLVDVNGTPVEGYKSWLN